MYATHFMNAFPISKIPRSHHTVQMPRRASEPIRRHVQCIAHRAAANGAGRKSLSCVPQPNAGIRTACHYVSTTLPNKFTGQDFALVSRQSYVLSFRSDIPQRGNPVGRPPHNVIGGPINAHDG